MKKGPRDRQEDENLDDFAEQEYWKILKNGLKTVRRILKKGLKTGSRTALTEQAMRRWHIPWPYPFIFYLKFCYSIDSEISEDSEDEEQRPDGSKENYDN